MSESDSKVRVTIRGGRGNVVVAGGSNVAVEGGIHNAVTINTARSASLVEVRERVAGLREALHGMDAFGAAKGEIEAEIDSGLAQLRNREPDRQGVKLTLHNALRALELLSDTSGKQQLVRELTAVVSML